VQECRNAQVVQSWKQVSESFEKSAEWRHKGITEEGREEGKKDERYDANRLGGRDSDRSNSKARSLARMPDEKPVTYRVEPLRLLIVDRFTKEKSQINQKEFDAEVKELMNDS
jgi:hypothetical protein